MSHATLTARYRPQTFAQAAGQDTLRAILSRAAAEDRVAPAYLFSGTRGVGKTTLARVFAKALNCVQAPAAEPCNECERCRQITLGMAVDVVEIDGASNRGIDDVRRLKEVVGYAPMDGRYKVFIIDEAHMLSRDAFNALLKTLEEPPARVTFIMATTEPHKFPATILSRCQHYVFKRLSEAELEAHLTRILQAEKLPFDEAALRLLARRASGSVRDGMSLLGQVLALGGERLTEADTRRVLGLAGQELFFRLLEALREGDCLAVCDQVRDLMDGGLDLGFFLRELTLVWRNLFMLRQSGERAIPGTGLPENEAKRWLEEASRFSATHVHAAWQMTLDGQRRVLTSLEPAQALELLLLNIAMLPQLLPIDQLKASPTGSGNQAPPGGRKNVPAAAGGSASAMAPAQTAPVPDQSTSPSHSRQDLQAERERDDSSRPVSPSAAPASDCPTAPKDMVQTSPPAVPDAADTRPPMEPNTPEPVAEVKPQNESGALTPSDPGRRGEPVREQDVSAALAQEGPVSEEKSTPDETADPGPEQHPEAKLDAEPELRPGTGWDGFLRHMAARDDLPPGFAVLIRPCRASVEGTCVVLTPPDTFIAGRLAQSGTAEKLLSLMREYFGPAVSMRVEAPMMVTKSMQEVKAEALEHPGVQLLMQTFNARLASCEQVGAHQ